MKKILFFAGVVCAIGSMLAQPKIVAHRGYWDTEGSAQNSIASLLKADSLGVWGSEFDVWISADGVPVVFHDAEAEGIRLENAPASEILSIHLRNGETIPTVEDYFTAAENTSVQLICELKSHTDKERESVAVDALLEAAARHGLEDRIQYITFSYPGLLELIEKAPQGTKVWYLEGDLSPASLRSLGAAGMDYHVSVYRQYPEWVAQAKELGMGINVWTVNSDEDFDWCREADVDYITTDRPYILP